MRISFLLLSVIVLTSTLSFNSKAADSRSFDERYYQISEVKSTITEIKQSKEANKAHEELFSQHVNMPAVPAAGGLALLDVIDRIWGIIEANKPVATLKLKSANGIPEVAKDNWQVITGWQTSRSFKVRTEATNPFGIKVVDFEYQVLMLYGGNYKGKGLFLLNVRAIPVDLSLKWGMNVNVSVSIPSIANVGTEEDPIAAIQLDVTMDIRTMTVHRVTTDSYQVQGDGKMINLQTAHEIYSTDSKFADNRFRY